VRAVMLAALLALLLGAPARAAEPRPTLPDIEDEVMCVECGTVLNVSTSAVADDQREFIQDRIDRGQSKEEIKQALVAEFGPDVLAMPDGEGFNLAVYVVPAVLGLLGLAGVALAARRWRRARQRDDGAAEPRSGEPALNAADEQRLAAELAAFDR
jgi:cytochrome c-type biogenesis protein CcmH